MSLLVWISLVIDDLIQAKGSIDEQIQPSMIVVRIHILNAHYRLIMSIATLHPSQRKLVSDLLSHWHC